MQQKASLSKNELMIQTTDQQPLTVNLYGEREKKLKWYQSSYSILNKDKYKIKCK